MGFPTKNDHFGVFWGYHHLRKHPYLGGLMFDTFFVPSILEKANLKLVSYHWTPKPMKNEGLEPLQYGLSLYLTHKHMEVCGFHGSLSVRTHKVWRTKFSFSHMVFEISPQLRSTDRLESDVTGWWFQTKPAEVLPLRYDWRMAPGWLGVVKCRYYN